MTQKLYQKGRLPNQNVESRVMQFSKADEHVGGPNFQPMTIGAVGGTLEVTKSSSSEPILFPVNPGSSGQATIGANNSSSVSYKGLGGKSALPE